MTGGADTGPGGAGAGGAGAGGAGAGGAGAVPAGAGPANGLTDVRGLRVGHATLTTAGWLTGTTVVLADGEGAVAGVDVRGSGPGTRETDLLDPRNTVERVQAIVLSGGSAYGLAAATGVMGALAAAGRGVQVAPDPASVVPIVPAAILFDLGRGGVFGHHPGEEAGRAAYNDAVGPAGAGPVRQGNVGAGTGAVAGGIRGGIGTASAVLPGGAVVAALAAVNAHGSPYHPATGVLYGAQFGLPGEFDWLRPPGETPSASGVPGAGLFGHGADAQPFNTTIGVVATDLTLTKAQCSKLAAVGQDGLARAIRPAHTMSDGDTIFGLATCAGPAPSLEATHDLLAAAADCFTRAVMHAVLAATTVSTPAGTWLSYLDTFPSAASPGVSS